MYNALDFTYILYFEGVACQWFCLGTPVSSTNKTDRQRYSWNIVESGIQHHNPNPLFEGGVCIISNVFTLFQTEKTHDRHIWCLLFVNM
jgi:hypothetical protein